jgi:hypothetical protein
MATTNRNQGMNWIRKNKRLALYLRDGMACAYCGATMEGGAQLSLDHVDPRANGGKNHCANLITACMTCNRFKGDRELAEFCDSIGAYMDVPGEAVLAHVQALLKLDMRFYKQFANDLMGRRTSWRNVLAEAQVASYDFVDDYKED